MSLCLVDIHGDIEGDYDIIRDIGFIPALGQIPTNGDVIKAILSNAEIDTDQYSPSVDIRIDGFMMMRVDRNWWNAPYKRSEGE